MASNRGRNRTKMGLLRNAHENMRRRVKGKEPSRFNQVGMELLSFDEFVDWAHSYPEFHELFDTWERLGFPRGLTPCANRIHPLLGYEPLNLCWVTLSESNRRSAAWQHYNHII